LIYPDTSFVVSLYLDEARSQRAQRLRRASSERFALTELHQAEWAHVLGQNVLRKRISPSQAQAVQRAMEDDLAAGVWAVLPLPPRAVARCQELALQFAHRLPIRILDTLHVASAIELAASRFCTWDRQQSALARAAGLST